MTGSKHFLQAVVRPRPYIFTSITYFCRLHIGDSIVRTVNPHHNFSTVVLHTVLQYTLSVCTHLKNVHILYNYCTAMVWVESSYSASYITKLHMQDWQTYLFFSIHQSGQTPGINDTRNFVQVFNLNICRHPLDQCSTPKFKTQNFCCSVSFEVHCNLPLFFRNTLNQNKTSPGQSDRPLFSQHIKVLQYFLHLKLVSHKCILTQQTHPNKKRLIIIHRRILTPILDNFLFVPFFATTVVLSDIHLHRHSSMCCFIRTQHPLPLTFSSAAFQPIIQP